MPHIVPLGEIQVKTQAGKQYLISRFRHCKITLSRNLPCDIAELTLPKLDQLKLFQENDEIKIILGNDQIGKSPVFTGYISELSPTNEPILKCEDYFKDLKQKRNSKHWFETDDEIAQDIIEYCDFTPVIPETLEKKQHFYWQMQTAAECLAELAKNGWDYFCIPTTKKIYFGRPYYIFECYPELVSGSHSYIFRFTHNIIESQLAYRTANPINKAIVYIINTKFRGNSIRVDVPKENLEPSKIFNLQMDFDPTSEDSRNGAISQATKFAKQEISKSQTAGYQGNFKTFGNPYISHSQKIKIDDPEKQERSGHYFIDQVIHEIGPDVGYKMEITVGGKDSGAIA